MIAEDARPTLVMTRASTPSHSGVVAVPAPAPAQAPVAGKYLVARVRSLLDAFPMRLAGSAGERGLQERCASELAAYGGAVEWHAFSWTRSLYASLALHFGLACAAIALGYLQPLSAAGVHLFVAVSYISESLLKQPILAAWLPRASSQNAIVTFPARRTMNHRIVTLAHADAATTGLLFDPEIVRLVAKESTNPLRRVLRKSIALATLSVLALASVEIVTGIAHGGPRSLTIGLRVLTVVLALPSLFAFLFTADVVLRQQVVPAANDNLSGCVATLELARRLAPALPDDVELVTVITGCEEAGVGGAAHLVSEMLATERWSPESTTVLALDTFSGGEPRLVQEGELLSRPIPPALLDLSARVTKAERLPDVTPYEIPSGATDAWPFLTAGFEAVGITCIDPELGAPRHYHLPSDTADNLDPGLFERTFAFTERFITALARERSRGPRLLP